MAAPIDAMPTPRHTTPLTDEQQRILQQVEATFVYMGGTDSDAASTMLPWLSEMFGRVRFSDFTSAELTGLTAIIWLGFARRLRGESLAEPLRESFIGLRLV